MNKLIILSILAISELLGSNLYQDNIKNAEQEVLAAAEKIRKKREELRENKKTIKNLQTSKNTLARVGQPAVLPKLERSIKDNMAQAAHLKKQIQELKSEHASAQEVVSKLRNLAGKAQAPPTQPFFLPSKISQPVLTAPNAPTIPTAVVAPTQSPALPVPNVQPIPATLALPVQATTPTPVPVAAPIAPAPSLIAPTSLPTLPSLPTPGMPATTPTLVTTAPAINLPAAPTYTPTLPVAPAISPPSLPATPGIIPSVPAISSPIAAPASIPTTPIPTYPLPISTPTAAASVPTVPFSVVATSIPPSQIPAATLFPGYSSQQISGLTPANFPHINPATYATLVKIASLLPQAQGVGQIDPLTSALIAQLIAESTAQSPATPAITPASTVPPTSEPGKAKSTPAAPSAKPPTTIPAAQKAAKPTAQQVKPTLPKPVPEKVAKPAKQPSQPKAVVISGSTSATAIKPASPAPDQASIKNQVLKTEKITPILSTTTHVAPTEAPATEIAQTPDASKKSDESRAPAIVISSPEA